MKFERTEVSGMANAIHGMRNPMNSWHRGDSKKSADGFELGPNDLELAQRLIKAGPVHSKFLRQIFVSVQITAPLYWWKEMDTYKVGTVANSTSTMHKLTSKPITQDCFEYPIFEPTLEHLETLRKNSLDHEWFDEDKRKEFWKQLVVELPEGWLQTRMWSCNYEVLRNILRWRKNHKLTEWKDDFINWMKSLPYANELIFLEDSSVG